MLRKALLICGMLEGMQALTIQAEADCEKCPISYAQKVPTLTAMKPGAQLQKRQRFNLCGLRCHNGKCTYRGGLCGKNYGDQSK